MAQEIAERWAELSDLGQQGGKLAARMEALQAQIKELPRTDLDSKRANSPIMKHPGDQFDAERLANLNQANLTRGEQIDLRRQRLAEMVD